MADLDVSIKKINDLTAQAEASEDDLLAVGNNETGLLKKITVKNHAESIKNTIIGESEEIADIADGTVVGAIKQFDSDIPETQGIVTDAFDETKTYSAGDYCIYNNTLYKFKEEKTAGEWDDDPELVEAVTVMGELNSALANKLDKNDSDSSFTTTVNTAGYLTSSNTQVLFMIAITNKDRTIDSITTNNTQIRQNGYLTGSSSGTDDFPSGGSTTFSQTALGTRVTLVFPSSIGGTNNDAVGVCASLTVKFKS